MHGGALLPSSVRPSGWDKDLGQKLLPRCPPTTLKAAPDGSDRFLSALQQRNQRWHRHGAACRAGLTAHPAISLLHKPLKYPGLSPVATGTGSAVTGQPCPGFMAASSPSRPVSQG